MRNSENYKNEAELLATLKDRYAVVSARAPSTLVANVNRALAQGWVVLGGLQTLSHEGPGYHQSMTRSGQASARLVEQVVALVLDRALPEKFGEMSPRDLEKKLEEGLIFCAHSAMNLIGEFDFDELFGVVKAVLRLKARQLGMV